MSSIRVFAKAVFAGLTGFKAGSRAIPFKTLPRLNPFIPLTSTTAGIPITISQQQQLLFST